MPPPHRKRQRQGREPMTAIADAAPMPLPRPPPSMRWRARGAPTCGPASDAMRRTSMTRFGLFLPRPPRAGGCRPICSPSPSRSPPPSPRCCAGGPSPPGRAAGYTDGTRLYRPALLRRVSPASRLWAAETRQGGAGSHDLTASRAAAIQEQKASGTIAPVSPEQSSIGRAAASRLREPERWATAPSAWPAAGSPHEARRRRGLAA